MHIRPVLLVLVLTCAASIALSQANFSTSLHATREGKRTAYKKENGGMELITNIPMDSLSCLGCHAATNADGTPVTEPYAPGCADCHNPAVGTTVSGDRCYACHNRQTYERQTYPDSLETGDIHRKRGMNCLSCHSKAELHGDDGVRYSSWMDEGAMLTKCTDCHPLSSLSSNSSHDLHAQTGKMDCLPCHTTSIVSCTNCHFETLLATKKNRAMKRISNFELLVKRNGRISTGTYMTFTYDGKSNVIIAAFRSHLIQKNARTCADCHNNLGGTNAAINAYNASGSIQMTQWNSGTNTLDVAKGVIPIPGDWQTALKFDFADYTGDVNNITSDPTKWVYLKSTVDNSHLYYVEPLDSAALAKLGVTRFPTGVGEGGPPVIPASLELQQNYPNPFNPSTIIRYAVPRSSRVELKVYNLEGEEVATLVDRVQPAGTHECRFDGAGLSSGVYLYRLHSEGSTVARKLLLVR